MQEIREQLGRIETKLDELMSLKEIVLELTEAKRIERQKERLRKTAMRTAARAERNASSLVLRDNIFKKDVRLREHFKKWAVKGLEFGQRNRPEEFAEYVSWQWNSCTFTRKPITFSGGYFQYWIGKGTTRMHTTPFELMNLSKKNKLLLKNSAEWVDFRDRMWWDWGYTVWYAVLNQMEDLPGYDELPKRFIRCCKLLAGGFGQHEVYTGLYFDPAENMSDVNRMLRRVGGDLMNMWKGCCTGLRRRDKPT
jgi:hypothetical protein